MREYQGRDIMPMHDWARVDASVSNAFTHNWRTELARWLNSGNLPGQFYALPTWHEARANTAIVCCEADDKVVAAVWPITSGDRNSRRGSTNVISRVVEFTRAGVHVLLLDLIPMIPGEQQDIPASIWRDLTGREMNAAQDKPLSIVSFECGPETNAYIEPLAVGDSLREMPLFIDVGIYVSVSLEITYQSAFGGLPERWRHVLDKA
jgi:hypothetical protein